MFARESYGAVDQNGHGGDYRQLLVVIVMVAASGSQCCFSIMCIYLYCKEELDLLSNHVT